MPKEKLLCFSAKMNPILATITNVTHGQRQFDNLYCRIAAIHYYRDPEIATVCILPHPPYIHLHIYILLQCNIPMSDKLQKWLRYIAKSSTRTY